ncbi:MAG TPA: DUF6719 family protein [Bradyrhizobium sp.]|nr:DUF6719 family protein [Bradyrhizobium sp.]
MTGDCDISLRTARRLPQAIARASVTKNTDAWVVLILFCVLAWTTCNGLFTATHAQQFSQEKDIGDLRLGQRVKVDDGTCPAGQIKEVSGTKMTESGVVRSRKCIPRAGLKQK